MLSVQDSVYRLLLNGLMGGVGGRPGRRGRRAVRCCIDGAGGGVAVCRGVSAAISVAVGIRCSGGTCVVNGQVSLPSVCPDYFNLECCLIFGKNGQGQSNAHYQDESTFHNLLLYA